MLRRSNYLPFLVLASLTIILFLSCTQSEDIVTPISTTDIALTAERLPTPPPGMAYELWVANDQDTLSLGKFLFDGSSQEFRDLQGNVRSDSFALSGDIFKYSTVFVSIENIPDADPAVPGPIMLVDDVSKPEDRPMRMRFPESDSLSLATIFYNYETPTDLDRNAAVGSGIWFTRYQVQTKSLPDTTAQTWTLVDSIVDDSSRFPFTYPCSVTDTSLVSGPINFGGPEFLWMGATLPTHYGVNFTMWYCVDSTPTFEGQVLTGTFATTQRNYNIDWFSQDGFLLPNLTRFGWHYKGWVVTPYPTGMTSRWRFTKPAYRYNSPNLELIPGDTGVLFPTGSFADLHSPDDGNPYSLANPTPPYPGEDFLNSTALQNTWGITSVNFLPNASGNKGTVFISIEPNNLPAALDTTNFPLIALVAPVPSRQTTIQGSPIQLGMDLMTSTVPGNTVGFPVVTVSIKRF